MIKYQKGIIALITILIIGAVLLLITVGIAYRSRISSNIVLDQEKSNNATTLTTSCIEYALAMISNNSNYLGNETISFGEESCTIGTITSPAQNILKIQASANVEGFSSRLVIQVNKALSPMQIVSWEEVDSF